VRIIRFSDLQETPWRNGGGITREIAVEQAGDKLVWRLSMADVGVDGPFSKFDGLRRILTVIEGGGMELVSPHIKLQADLCVPVRFDGGWEVEAKLKNGPLRDLNLIYDPEPCVGDVQVISGTRTFVASRGGTYAIYCVEGTIVVNETNQLHRGDTALIEQGSVVVAETARALLITLTFLGGSAFRSV
jgi:uncharacterized protein